MIGPWGYVGIGWLPWRPCSGPRPGLSSRHVGGPAGAGRKSDCAGRVAAAAVQAEQSDVSGRMGNPQPWQSHSPASPSSSSSAGPPSRKAWKRAAKRWAAEARPGVKRQCVRRPRSFNSSQRIRRHLLPWSEGAVPGSSGHWRRCTAPPASKSTLNTRCSVRTTSPWANRSSAFRSGSNQAASTRRPQLPLGCPAELGGEVAARRREYCWDGSTRGYQGKAARIIHRAASGMCTKPHFTTLLHFKGRPLSGPRGLSAGRDSADYHMKANNRCKSFVIRKIVAPRHTIGDNS